MKRRFGYVVVLCLFPAAVWLWGCSKTLYYADVVDGSDSTSDTNTGTLNGDVDDEKRGICGASSGQLFGSEYPWNQRVDELPLDPESDDIIDYLTALGDWPGLFEIAGANGAANESYGMPVLMAGNDTPEIPFVIREDSFWLPACDYVSIPLPAAGAVEGEVDYGCQHDGSCHLVILDRDDCLLYEMYRGAKMSDSFRGGCLALWDLLLPFASSLRGDCCTSAEAAGLPIAPLTFSADEIAVGEIAHAIRFSIPTEYVRPGIFVRPATHTSVETYGSEFAPPRGARLRLKATYSLPAVPAAARIIVTALKKYGMILADPGHTTFVAEDERFTANTWAAVGLNSASLMSLKWSDFEVVDGGERFQISGCRCERDAIDE